VVRPNSFVGKGGNMLDLCVVLSVAQKWEGALGMRRRWMLTAVVIGLFGLALPGCHGIGKAVVDPLDGTSWLLGAIEGRAPLPDIKITAVFDGGKVHGSSGCNTFGGSYRIDGNKIKIGELQSTLMACLAPPEAMDQEQKFLELLSASGGYQIAGGRLRLMNSGRVVLEFIPQD
jgi:heat shock protein HslJ